MNKEIDHQQDKSDDKKKNYGQRQFYDDRKPSRLVTECGLQNKNKNGCDDGTDNAESDGKFQHVNLYTQIIVLIEEVDVKDHPENDPDQGDHQ